MLGMNCKGARTRNNPPGRIWTSVSARCRAKPASRAAAGEAFPANCPGQNKTSVRRVTAATPRETRKPTAIPKKRVARLDTGMKFPHVLHFNILYRLYD